MATQQQALLATLRRRRKIRLDAGTLRGLIDRAAEYPEFMRERNYTWDLVRDVPIELLNPPTREDYEMDPDLSEEEVEENLDRYDDLVRQLIYEGKEPWPIVVDVHGLIIDGFHRLAVLAAYAEKTVDIVWVRPK